MSGSSLSLRNLGATAPSAPTSTAGTSSLTTILIYESVIAFLKRSCNIRILGRDEADRLQSTLDGYMQSMLSESLVDAIVDSLGYRKILLELSSELGFAADPNLRIALREDEERIAAVLVFILHSKSAERAALSLEGSAAQSFLDVVQDTLDRGFLMTQDHSWKARRIIRKLSESCDKLPSSLFITGVNGRDEHPMFGGGFGDIYRASYENQTVALKSMRHFLRGGELRRVRWEFCREALVWKDLHHPHILTFLGIDRESFPSTLCMVSPWMEHGTVLTYLHDHGHANVDKLLFEIAQGLQYLHSHNVVHGDLRGANILINQDWSACLADFGLSVFSDATTHTSNRAGSIYWMSPELIAPERFGYRFARTPASDVYAFGCVCIELYTGRPPFSELSEAAALLSIINGERPRRPSGTPAMSDSLWRHLTAYWQHNPTARPVTELVVQNMVWPALNREPTPVQTRTHRSTDPPTYIIYPDNQLDGLQPQTYREESPYTQPPSLWDWSVDYQSKTRDRGSGSRSSSETRDLPAASITIQPEDSRSWHSRSRSRSPEGQIVIQPPYSEAASDGTYYPTASDPTYYPEPYYYPSAPLPGMYPQPPATRKNPLLALFRPLLQAMKRNDSKSNSAPIYNPYSHYPPPQTVIVQPSWPTPEQMPLGYYAPPTIPMSPYYSPTQMPAYYGAPAPIIITSRSSSSSRSRSRSSSPSRLPGMTGNSQKTPAYRSSRRPRSPTPPSVIMQPSQPISLDASPSRSHSRSISISAPVIERETTSSSPKTARYSRSRRPRPRTPPQMFTDVRKWLDASRSHSPSRVTGTSSTELHSTPLRPLLTQPGSVTMPNIPTRPTYRTSRRQSTPTPALVINKLSRQSLDYSRSSSPVAQAGITSNSSGPSSNPLRSAQLATPPSSTNSHPRDRQLKARALHDYTASESDPTEISFSQNEILDIINNQNKWWEARKSDGTVGIAPSNFLEMIDTADASPAAADPESTGTHPSSTGSNDSGSTYYVVPTGRQKVHVINSEK